MTLLLLAIFREYKQYWFKIVCTIVGIVISLSLFIVIELFSYLFEVPTKSSVITAPYTHKLVHNQGKITNTDVKTFYSHPLLRDLSPYSEAHDHLTHPDFSLDVLVKGMDRFQLTKLFSNTNLKISNPKALSPFDLNQTLLLSPQCETGTSQTLTSQLSQQPIQSICIEFDLNEPILFMDIALFQSLYLPKNAVDSLLYVFSDADAQIVANVLKKEFPNHSLISVKKDQEQQSHWVHSLTYNLKFLAFISLIVSTSLMIQFFRFLAKQRRPMFDQLFHLGVSSRVIKQLFLLEIGLIAIITNGAAHLLAHGIAVLSLDVFNQIITMFYFKFSSTHLVFHWRIVLKAMVASLGSFVVAYLSYFYGKPLTVFRPIMPIGFASLCVISLGVVVYFPHQWLVILSLIAIIAGFFGLCISSMAFIGHALKRVTSQRLVAFKMCRDTLRRDPLSYGAIAFVISLSAGLVISMSLFVNSFSHTVTSWLTTVTFHDIYIQHPANTLQYPMALPKEVLQIINELGPTQVNVSTLFRVPFIYNGYPTQIVFRTNLHDPDFSRFLFKERLPGPYTQYDAFITEPFAMKHRLKLGDMIQLNGIIEPKLRVVGITHDFLSEFGQIMVNDALHNQTFDSPIHGIALTATSPAVLQSLIPTLSHIHGVQFLTRKRMIDEAMTIFNDTFSFTWFVVFLTACIAIFSLVNLLTITCINRQKELTQLWHIGFNARRLTALILAQITIIGGVSSVMGLAIGGCFYVLIVHGIQQPTFHWSIFLHVPWHLLILTPILTLGLCLLIGSLFMARVSHNLGKGRVNESLCNTH